MRLPRIKHVHYPERLSGNRIRIGTLQYGISSEVQDDDVGTIWRMLGLMDGTRTVDTIVSEMRKISLDLDEQSIYEAIETLIDNGFVEDAGALPPEELTPEELGRYNRNLNYFAWVDNKPRTSLYEHQQRLKNAKVTILGLGGSGSAMAMSLAAAGVGLLHCIDYDYVEESNLNRQLLFIEDDIGRSKVEAAIERLRRLNSHITVTGKQLELKSSDDIVPLVEGCDLFVLCADSPPEKIDQWANEAALRTNTPWLVSAYAGPMIVVGIYIPFSTPCYQCFIHDQNQRCTIRDGCKSQALFNFGSANAVIAPTANMTGHLGALEAIYLLTGLQPQTIGRLFHQNLMIYEHFYFIEAPFWTECPFCGPESTYRKSYERFQSLNNYRTNR